MAPVAVRADIRQTIFGERDAATRLAALASSLTGADVREKRAHVPTADRFLGTYDLTPLTQTNVALWYLRASRTLLEANHIPYVAFLTPTNHHLLADYINSREYDDNLRALEQTLRGPGGVVLNFDRAMATTEFLDNDHLTGAQ